VAHVRARDGVDRGAGLHRVGAAAAVHVQVDEAGQQDQFTVVAPGVVGDALAINCNDVLPVDRHATPPQTVGSHESAFKNRHVDGDLGALRLLAISWRDCGKTRMTPSVVVAKVVPYRYYNYTGIG
jgi:hypothetical protein